MSSDKFRLGFVWPGGGAEHDFYRFLEEIGDHIRLYISCTRVGGDGENDHDISALEQTARLDWLVEACQRLIPLDVDCVYWPCTSGSFVLGRYHAEIQTSVLSTTAGVPAGSTSLAFIAALKHCGFKKVSILSTYPRPASKAFASFLKEFEIEVLRMKWLGAPSGWDAALFEPDYIIENIPSVLHEDAEALLIPDTAMPSMFSIEDFEKVAQLPTFTANGVSMWNAMKLMGANTKVPNFGSLFAGKLDSKPNSDVHPELESALAK